MRQSCVPSQRAPLFPYAALFRSGHLQHDVGGTATSAFEGLQQRDEPLLQTLERAGRRPRSEEHTSELQSRPHLVCRLLLEKKNSEKEKHYLDRKKKTIVVELMHT